MKPIVSFSIKTGLAALGLVAGLAFPAMSAPMPPTAPATPNSPISSQILPVGEGYTNEWRWRRSNRNWHHDNYDRRNWNRREWHRRNWDRRGWYPRDHYRHYGGSGFYFGLGGFGMGLGAPVYRSYVAPRRVYRYGPANAHVQWCYARYRSYRAYDNTFQPNRGPRRQCRSPY